MNVRVVSRVAEQQKLGHFKKIPEMLGYDGECPGDTKNTNFDICAKISLKLTCKTFHRKTYFT